ncbi:MAG: site-specific DNA-methyltransferase [Candidatus Cloacimonadales bacterium]
MEKIPGTSKDLLAVNIDNLKQLFPEAFTEDKIDFEALKEVLGEYVETDRERYAFTWAGKQQARREAQKVSIGTLRPCKEESVNFDTTENLYIEGDNLEVLKLLQKSYHNKIKMIYIDPPYNTGKDFVYKDNYHDNLQNYKALTGQVDSEGNRLSTNSESSGRFHSNWLNMMYPRLKLARNLLKDDGVIFISIDDNEVHNLRKICDEIFGEENLVGNVIWERAFAPKNDAKYISNSHDYISIYTKKIDSFKIGKLERTQEANNRYTNLDNDPRGIWASDNLTVKTYSEAYDYEITTPSGKVVKPTNGRCWFTNIDKMQELIDDNRIWFGKDGNNMPRLKRFLVDVQSGMVPISIWYNKDVGHNQQGRQEVKRLFDDKGVFDGPKPVCLLLRILQIANLSQNDIILDFFSGSSTTAHAVLELNKEDKGNRKFIMVQLPEPTDDKSEAFKAGYKTIAEIGKERIRRVIKTISNDKNEQMKIEETNPDISTNRSELDLGFKVLKLDSSNIKAWDTQPEELEENLLDIIDNIKEDRTEEDILYEILLKYGFDLTLPIEQITIAGNNIYNVDSGALICSLSDNISLETVEGIGQLKVKLNPENCRVVFRDNGFRSDVVKTNAMHVLTGYGIEEVRSI